VPIKLSQKMLFFFVFFFRPPPALISSSTELRNRESRSVNGWKLGAVLLSARHAIVNSGSSTNVIATEVALRASTGSDRHPVCKAGQCAGRQQPNQRAFGIDKTTLVAAGRRTLDGNRWHCQLGFRLQSATHEHRFV